MKAACQFKYPWKECGIRTGLVASVWVSHRIPLSTESYKGWFSQISLLSSKIQGEKKRTTFKAYNSYGGVLTSSPNATTFDTDENSSTGFSTYLIWDPESKWSLKFPEIELCCHPTNIYMYIGMYVCMYTHIYVINYYISFANNANKYIYISLCI